MFGTQRPPPTTPPSCSAHPDHTKTLAPACRRKGPVALGAVGPPEAVAPKGCGPPPTLCPGSCGLGGLRAGTRLTASALPLQYQVEPGQLGTRCLQVSVWHLGTLTRRVFLGEVTIPLATWDFEDSTTQCFCWYPLRAKVRSGLELGYPTLTMKTKLPFQRD